ncbi:MAG: cystathionine gamma-synthase family protein [Longimicrobiales bacterium]
MNTRHKEGPSPKTLAVWGGEEGVDKLGATQMPVVNSVSFDYPDLDTWLDVATGKSAGHIYGRNTNPTVEVFEDKVNLLEGGESSVSFSTGMAAITGTLFSLLEPGKRVVSIKDSYGGTNVLFTDYLPKYGVQVDLCDTDDHKGIEGQVAQGCDILYLETPTNPTVKIVDIKRLSVAAHQVGALVVVDNTFATPINQKPLQLGADIVLHSATKFLGGHADALGGVVSGSEHLLNEIFRFKEITGASLHPESAYLLIRGMKTLGLRIAQQNASAMQIAQYLESHEKIDEVFYPGLTSHQNHDVAVSQMQGFGGMLSFKLKGGYGAVKQFLPKLRYVNLAANLGSVETVAGPPATTSHVECSPEEREAMGIPEGLIRYSVGIEDVSDLICDLGNALEEL